MTLPFLNLVASTDLQIQIIHNEGTHTQKKRKKRKKNALHKSHSEEDVAHGQDVMQNVNPGNAMQMAL